MQRATAGLFSDPQLYTDVVGAKPEWLGQQPVLGYSLTGLELLSGVIEPALRTLRLLGFQIVEIEFTDLASLGDDTAPAPEMSSASIICDGSHVYAEKPADTVAMLDYLTAEYAIRIFAQPYIPKGTQVPAYHLGLNDTEGTEWRMDPDDASGSDGAQILSLWVDPSEHPTNQSVTPAEALGQRAVNDFVEAAIPTLASLFPAALPADNSAEAAPQIGQTGLLWLLDPRSWYPTNFFSGARHARALRNAALHALPARSTANADIQTYLRALLNGDDNLRKSLKSVTNEPILSFFRAGDFRRAIVRWNAADDPYFEPLAKGQISATRNLAWLDLIFWLIEAKIANCPYVDMGAPYETDDEASELEPLVARKVLGNHMALDLLHTCMGDPQEGPDRDVLCTITAVRMPMIETETVYDTPPTPPPQEEQEDGVDGNAHAQWWTSRPFEQMFTWEYVPVDDSLEVDPDTDGSDAPPEPPNDQKKPKLLIVAGPGVSIEFPRPQETVDVVILRKSDYGFGPWGTPIRPEDLYRPYFLPLDPPPQNPNAQEWAHISLDDEAGADVDGDLDSDADPDGDSDGVPTPASESDQPDLTQYYLTHGVHVSERPDGVTYSAFQDIYVHQETGMPLDLGDGPWARFDIRYADPKNGTVGYRADFDYVTFHTDEPGYEDIKRRPMLRIFASAPVRNSSGEVITHHIKFAAAESFYEEFDVELHECDDIAQAYLNWPHMVPIIEREIRFIDPAFEHSELPDEDALQYHWAVPTAAVTAFDTQRLPLVTEAQFTQAQFRAVTLNAQNTPTEYIASWIDFWLMIPDLLIGLHPASIAIDIAEFAYAYNTGRDRYGRPITNQDLFLMGLGIGLPVTGSVLSTVRRGLVVSKTVWKPATTIITGANGLPVSRAGKAKEMMDLLTEATAEVAESGADQAFRTKVGRIALATNLLLNVGAMFTGSGSLPANYEIANLMDASGRDVIDPGTSHHYRRWLLDKLLTDGTGINPMGGS